MRKTNQHWVSQGASFGSYDNPRSAIRNPQSGYALVSLLVFMSLLALFALTAGPQGQRQARREGGKEAIFRGQRAAEALGSYSRFTGAQGVIFLPPRIVPLLEGL